MREYKRFEQAWRQHGRQGREAVGANQMVSMSRATATKSYCRVHSAAKECNAGAVKRIGGVSIKAEEGTGAKTHWRGRHRTRFQ